MYSVIRHDIFLSRSSRLPASISIELMLLRRSSAVLVSCSIVVCVISLYPKFKFSLLDSYVVSLNCEQALTSIDARDVFGNCGRKFYWHWSYNEMDGGGNIGNKHVCGQIMGCVLSGTGVSTIFDTLMRIFSAR